MTHKAAPVKAMCPTRKLGILLGWALQVPLQQTSASSALYMPCTNCIHHHCTLCNVSNNLKHR